MKDGTEETSKKLGEDIFNYIDILDFLILE